MKPTLLLGLGMLAFSALARAGDDDAVQPLTSPYEPSGYIDLHGGYAAASQHGSFTAGGTEIRFEGDSDAAIFGAAGRGAVSLTPAVRLQLDFWTNTFTGTSTNNIGGDSSFSSTFAGMGGHLTYQIREGPAIGGLLSVGLSDEDGVYSNVGVEGVRNFGDWRLYGQTGYTFAISGDAADDDSSEWYADALLAHYFHPNLMVSGSVSYNYFSNDNVSGDQWGWGGRAEYKAPTLPFTGYVALQALHWDTDTDAGTLSGDEYIVLVGTRFLFNQETIRGIDTTVGLRDLNNIYGDFPH